MKRTQKTTGVVAILALALILVGCNTPTVVVPPTQDVPSIRTEAAQTIVAKITIDAALNVTPSPEVTDTPAQPQVVTATTAPSATAAQATATTAAGSVATATLVPVTRATSAPYPTFTLRPGPDQAQYISQTPGDGAVFHPGNQFDAVWTFKNIGTSTWNTNYSIRMASTKGTQMSPRTRYYIKSPVKPGDTVNLVADMQAPTTAGRYVEYWELVNDNGAIFYNFYVVIDVTAP